MRTRDLRVEGYRPLIPPAILLEQLPLPEASSNFIARARTDAVHVLSREDDRLLVVAGPCSVHDVAAGLEYARRLQALATELAQDLLVVMRVYFEKPRTTVGWKGLINDPGLDGTYRINDGLHLARRLLLDIAALGLPAGCEFLDPVSPQYTSDLVTWAAIGARTTESQVHRELASACSMPVGFKNGTGGTIQIAIDAVRAAAHPHRFIGVTEQGVAAFVSTRGNPDCHVILRGGARGPNYDRASVHGALELLRKERLPVRLVIDASHGNSERDHRKQREVVRDIVTQLAGGERGIVGVMLESFLQEGRQDLVDPRALVYGQSITDACLGWGDTVEALRELADGVRRRRAKGQEAADSAERTPRVASTKR